MSGVADSLRLVTRGSDGQRPSLALDLNDGVTYTKVRSSFIFTPAPPTLQRSLRARRYGGARTVGVTHDNGSVSWKAYVKGSSAASAAQAAEALLALIESTSMGRYLEWTPFGGSASYFTIAGPGQWSADWDPQRWSQTLSLVVTFTLPVLPLVSWAQPFILDRYVDPVNLVDYTFDSATSADVAVVAGRLAPVSGAALTVERRARYTARGYDFLEGQATLNAVLGTTVTGFKYGVLLRATSSTNYIEVYVDDNGTNSRLRIDVVIAGVRTNRSSTNLSSRLTASTFAGAVRGRIEGSVVIAEYSTSVPTPVSTPTLTASYTLVSGDAPLNTVAGKTGVSFVPQSSAAVIYEFEFRPWTYRLRTLPSTITPADPIPGSAPASAACEITHTGGTTAPAFALVSWAGRSLPVVNGMLAPFGVFTVLSPAFFSAFNLTSTADAAALGGTSYKDTTVSGVESYTLFWLFDPAVILGDDFSVNEVAVEVWARMSIPPTISTPNVVASVRSNNGTSFGAERFTDEWGAAGRTVIGGSGYRLYRLGTIPLPIVTDNRAYLQMQLAITSGVGSSGALAVDYLMLNPVRNRALSPTGKSLDATYPSFITSTSPTTKKIRSDLSAQTTAAAGVSGVFPWADHGLGGSLIEPPPGLVDWLFKLSAQVPDDPNVLGSDEQTTHTATVSLNITPRSFLLRST